MRRSTLPLVFAGIAAAAALWVARGRDAAPAGAAAPGAAPQQVDASPRPPTLPTPFVENRGQWAREAAYVARFGDLTAFLTDRGWTLALGAGDGERTAVRMAFGRAQPPRLVAEERLPGMHHYLLGNDPQRWRRDVPLFGAVRLAALYDGVDVRVRAHDRSMEYDLLLRPGADLGEVVVRVEGARGLRLDADGSLRIDTAAGPLRQPRPDTWEVDAAGHKVAVACDYVLLGEDTFGFAAPDWRTDLALVVDPALVFAAAPATGSGLVYSTYLGGSGGDSAADIAVDEAGRMYVTGNTGSTDFPTQSPLQPKKNADTDTFVTVLDPTGSTLIYSTYLGGSSRDGAGGIAVNDQGEVWVTGQTFSPDFPVHNPLSGSLQGYSDAFVTKLEAGGAALAYSTYLGGYWENYGEYATDIAVDDLGQAVVTGETWAYDFPVRNAFQSTYSTYGDTFLTKLDAAGTALIFSTYLGGAENDTGRGVAVDEAGYTYVTGFTQSSGFPVFEALQPNHVGTFLPDAFVAKFGPTGSPIYSTYLGGAGSDEGMAIAADSAGNAYVTGLAGSGFPLRNAFQPTTTGFDAFVTVLDRTGASLRYSSYLGGSGFDRGTAIATDRAGNAYVTGYTLSPDFPVRNAFQATFRGGPYYGDAFLARINAAGSAARYSTYLGGAGDDLGQGVAVDRAGNVWVAGGAGSANFPTQAAFQPSRNGFDDAFVSRLDTLPFGVSRYGASTPACGGTIPMNVTDVPWVSSTSFALTTSGAPPQTSGILLIGVAPDTAGTPLLGATIHVGLAPPVLAVPVRSDGEGDVAFPLGFPASAVGARIYTQFVFVNTPRCGVNALSASDALGITIQH